jgi:hypothetical protein
VERKCFYRTNHEGILPIKGVAMFYSFRKTATGQKQCKAKKAFYFLPLFILSFVFATGNLEFLEKKSSSQWSLKECKRLLENSPWAQTQTITTPFIETQNSHLTAEPIVTYSIQLRSAAPIMQAVERLHQLTNQSFNYSGSRGFGIGQSNDQVTVHMKCKSDNVMLDISLRNYWTKLTAEQLKDFVFLRVGKGEKAPIVRYVSPLFFPTRNIRFGKMPIGSEFDFVFPRQVNGRDLIMPGDEVLQLEFPHPNLTANAVTKLNRDGTIDLSRGRDDVSKGLTDFSKCVVKFKTENIKYQGTLAY